MKKTLWWTALAGAAVAPLVGCDPAAKDKTPAAPRSDVGAPNSVTAANGATTDAMSGAASGATARLASAPRAPVVLFVGTSLTAGYGLDPSQAFPALIQRKADSAGTPIRAVNAGVSGETSAGALHRIDWVLRAPADVVVIETGANDALRALPVSEARANISAILDRVKRDKPHARLFLVQMEAPPNLGTAYTTAFHDMYGELAREKGATLIPFLLAGVAGHDSLNQADGLHPNATGERIVAQNVWDSLAPALRGR